MVECEQGQPNSTNPLVEVCQKCGVRGYVNLLIYCDVCQVSAEHIYCLDRVSKVNQEVVEWSCEQCVPTYICNQLSVQPSMIVEERIVEQLADSRCTDDASQKVLLNPPLLFNETAYGFPITDHVRRLENLLHKSQLNMQASTAEAEAVTSDGKNVASSQLGKTLVEQEAQRDVPETAIPYKANVDFENKMKCLKNRFNRLNNRFNRLEEIEKAFLEKKSEMCALIASREAAAGVKEQAMLDRVQEQKDIAFVAITEARSKSSEHTVAVFDIQNRLKLRQFCKEMDSKGLLNYIMKYEKCMDAVRDEMPLALKIAAEPALFVLDLLKGFYPYRSQTTLCSEGSTRDAMELMCMRKSCLMLIESLPLVLGADDVMDRITKWQAKAIADGWKSRLDSRDAAIDYSLDEEAFLKLIATFGIASEFDEEEICKLVLAFSHHRQAPILCRSLGLKHRIPGIVEVLISKGRRIDAARFVLTFKLTKNYPPVDLLRKYLKDSRKDLLSKMNSSGGDDKIKSDLHVKELAAIKTVVECIQEYRLEAHYKLDPLLKRMIQLEQWKSNKKKMADKSVKNHPKKRAREDNGIEYEPDVPAGFESSPLVYNNGSPNLHESYRSELSSSYHSLFYP